MELQAMHEVGGACEWFLFDGKNFREFQGGNKTGLLNFVWVSSFWYNLIILKTRSAMTMVKYATIVQLHNQCRLYPLRDHS